MRSTQQIQNSIDALEAALKAGTVTQAAYDARMFVLQNELTAAGGNGGEILPSSMDKAPNSTTMPIWPDVNDPQL